MTQHLPRLWLRRLCLGLWYCFALTWSERAVAGTFCDQHQLRGAEIYGFSEQFQGLFWNKGLFDMRQNTQSHGRWMHILRNQEMESVESVHEVTESAAVLANKKSDCGRCSMSHVYLAGIALMFLVVLKMRHFTMRKRLELARLMVEQGIQPPEHLLGQNRGNDLKRGVVLTCAGLGLLAATGIGGAEKLASAGLIPIFVGIGYLICHRFARGHRRDSH